MVIEMMALDKEADVEVNQEVDKEVTKVIEEFCSVRILEKGLLNVNYVLKHFLVETT